MYVDFFPRFYKSISPPRAAKWNACRGLMYEPKPIWLQNWKRFLPLSKLVAGCSRSSDKERVFALFLNNYNHNCKWSVIIDIYTFLQGRRSGLISGVPEGFLRSDRWNIISTSADGYLQTRNMLMRERIMHAMRTDRFEKLENFYCRLAAWMLGVYWRDMPKALGSVSNPRGAIVTCWNRGREIEHWGKKRRPEASR